LLVSALDLSNFAGLTAIGLLTANILLGLLISTKYNPVRRWPHRRVDTVGIHNWTGYGALAVALVHPVLILFSSTAKFGVVDLLWPLGAPKQPVVNTFGALALYLLMVVVATSVLWQERRAIPRRTWKRFHYATYAMFPLYAVHSILTDPALKDRPIDPFDGEKVFVELCVLGVAVAIAFRVRWQRRQPPPRVHRSKAGRVGSPAVAPTRSPEPRG
jgi:predicted ferric reductase